MLLIAMMTNAIHRFMRDFSCYFANNSLFEHIMRISGVVLQQGDDFVNWERGW